MNDITLPKELAECRLSLEEIGAIFVLYSLKNIEEDSQTHWSTDEKMTEIGRTLVDRGIIKFSKNDDNENIMEIDISNVDFLKKDFWEVYDYDDNDNEILYHYSHYGDDDSRYRYELYPKLANNRVVWELKHSEYPIEGCSYIESLQEAEDIARSELVRELEQIKLENLNKSDGR